MRFDVDDNKPKHRHLWALYIYLPGIMLNAWLGGPVGIAVAIFISGLTIFGVGSMMRGAYYGGKVDAMEWMNQLRGVWGASSDEVET